MNDAATATAIFPFRQPQERESTIRSRARSGPATTPPRHQVPSSPEGEHTSDDRHRCAGKTLRLHFSAPQKHRSIPARAGCRKRRPVDPPHAGREHNEEVDRHADAGSGDQHETPSNTPATGDTPRTTPQHHNSPSSPIKKIHPHSPTPDDQTFNTAQGVTTARGANTPQGGDQRDPSSLHPNPMNRPSTPREARPPLEAPTPRRRPRPDQRDQSPFTETR